MCVENLRLLDCTALPADEEVKVKMTLLNAWPLSNKTFVLCDFSNSHALDLMFITEMWMRDGELAPLMELCPPDSSFFSSPRLTGRGGGIASLFNDTFKCKLISYCDPYTSVELQLFMINKPVVLIAVIYHPPKYNDKFISEFANFLSRFILHICCDDKPLVKDFLNVIQSFNLTQFVSGPTH